jgi:hypothetical protein
MALNTVSRILDQGAAQCRTLEDLVLAVGLFVALVDAAENRFTERGIRLRHSAALWEV